MNYKIGDKNSLRGHGSDFAFLTFQTFSVSVINYILFLFISIISARMLGPAGRGLLAVIILYPTLLLTLGHLSIYRVLTVQIAEKKYPFSDFPASVIMFIFAISLFLITGFLIVFFNFNRYFVQNVNFYIILLALCILPCSMVIQTFSSILQVKERIKEFNLANVIQTTLLLLFMIFLLMVYKTGVSGAIFSYFMSNLAAMFLVIYFVKRISPDKWRFNPFLLKDLIFDGAKLHIGVIANFIFLKIDVLILGYYHQPSSVGYYSIAVSMADLIILITLAIQNVFYAKIHKMIDDKQEMARNTVLVYKHALFLSIIMSFALAAVAKPVIKIFYGERFLPSLIPFLILLPGAWYLWQNTNLVYYLVGNRRFLLISLISSFGALINVVFNLLLIPKYDAVGASLASLIAYFVVGSLNFFAFIRIAKWKLKDFIKELAINREDIMLYRTFLKEIFRIRS